MVDDWVTEAVSEIERKENNLRELKEQVKKELIKRVDTGCGVSIKLLIRIKKL